MSGEKGMPGAHLPGNRKGKFLLLWCEEQQLSCTLEPWQISLELLPRTCGFHQLHERFPTGSRQDSKIDSFYRTSILVKFLSKTRDLYVPRDACLSQKLPCWNFPVNEPGVRHKEQGKGERRLCTPIRYTWSLRSRFQRDPRMTSTLLGPCTTWKSS